MPSGAGPGVDCGRRGYCGVTRIRVRALKAPSLPEFEIIAREAFRRLPRKFKDLCEGLVVQVDDFPTDEVLDQMGAETEFDLLGLFQGVGLPFRSDSAPVQMPNMIWL